MSDGVESLPFVNPRLTRLGAVRAGRENALRLLRSGSCVIAFPEGIKGSQKSFSERYRLQSFGRGGVIRIALEAGVPLVPVGIVGVRMAVHAHPVPRGRVRLQAVAAARVLIPPRPVPRRRRVLHRQDVPDDVIDVLLRVRPHRRPVLRMQAR